jgi:hypothetical protein
MADTPIIDNPNNSSITPPKKGGRPRGRKDSYKRVPRTSDRESKTRFLLAVTNPAKLQFGDTGEALKYLLARECELPEFSGMSNREALARVLLSTALDFDNPAQIAAAKIVLERVDGKLQDTAPVQIGTVILSPDLKDPRTIPPKLIPDFDDAELIEASTDEEL